jgi:hypothetical protein
MSQSEQSTTPPSSRNIVIASAVAFVVALLVLFTTILPAEFGVDPLGTGELLGLTALSRESPLEEQLEGHRQDYAEFELGPFQSVEYKYLMDFDAPMVFSWSADADLYYDMHAEPAGLGEEYAESFEQGNAASKSGSYHAPFAGIHGWFWENRGSRTVLLRIYAAGFIQTSTVFRDGGDYERAIDPVLE